MNPVINIPRGTDAVEVAILAKWLLNEAYICYKDVLANRVSVLLITKERKLKLEEMHTAFYLQAFYSNVQTTGDVKHLLQNLRKMLSMLKELDEITWHRFMSEKNLLL